MSELNRLIHNQHNWWRNWEHFWAIFHKLARQDDLENLVRWAQRKKLSGQIRYYSSLLIDTEIDLNRLALRQRDLYIWAHYLYSISRTLKPPHRRHSRGSATIYGRH